MFTALIRARAETDADASGAFDALAYAHTMIDGEREEREHAALAESVSRAALLAEVIAQYGATPALMAFADHDNGLSEFAGASPVAALEHFSPEQITANGDILVGALEGFMDTVKKGSGVAYAQRALRSRRVMGARAKSLSARAEVAKKAAQRYKNMGPKESMVGKTKRMSGELTKYAGEHKLHGAAALGGVVAAAGALYAIKKWADKTVPGTAAQVREDFAYARKNIEALKRLASISIPGEHSEEFDAKINSALGDTGTVVKDGKLSGSRNVFRHMPVTFAKAGFEPDVYKSLMKECDELHHAYGEACAHLSRESDEGDAKAGHLHLDAIHEVKSSVELALAAGDRVLAKAGKHFTTHKEDEAAGEGTED